MVLPYPQWHATQHKKTNYIDKAIQKNVPPNMLFKCYLPTCLALAHTLPFILGREQKPRQPSHVYGIRGAMRPQLLGFLS